MSTPASEPAALTAPAMASAWTLEAYVSHNEALRVADARFHVERDRRYSELQKLRDEKEQVKDKAAELAANLEREVRKYKDENMNELRSQLDRERGGYATKDDLVTLSREFTATIKPLVDFVAASQGGEKAVSNSRELVLGLIAAGGTLMAILSLTGSI